MSTQTTGVGWIPQDSFGARLLLARRHLGLSVKEAAQRCHVHYATWSTWERGSTPQNYAEIVLRVAENLGVDRDWLAWGGLLAAPTAGPTPEEGDQVTSVTKRYLRQHGVAHPSLRRTSRSHRSVSHVGSVIGHTDRHHSVTRTELPRPGVSRSRLCLNLCA